MDSNKNLSNQFLEEHDEDEYTDLHFRKGNRKASNDRKEKKKIRKFAKYDY